MSCSGTEIVLTLLREPSGRVEEAVAPFPQTPHFQEADQDQDSAVEYQGPGRPAKPVSTVGKISALETLKRVARHSPWLPYWKW